MSSRLPGERCICCRGRLTEIGGQRIVCADAVRVCVNDDGPHPTVEVTGLWLPWFAMARARRIVQSGRHPWLCLRCANAGLCFRCGTPYDRVPLEQIFSMTTEQSCMCRWWAGWGGAAHGARGKRQDNDRGAGERPTGWDSDPGRNSPSGRR